MIARGPNRRLERKGIALLATITVLSTLLIVGVLFALTVDLDLKASRYYRDAGQAEQVALEGLHRAIAELQYDMWGVSERVAFKLANSREKLDDAAYVAVQSSGRVPITQPRSTWRQSIERNVDGKTGVNVLTDYRWMESFDPGTLTGTHSGAVYHDEFLPEFTDNADVWELGLHVNRGDVYFEGLPPRSYGSDYLPAGGLWPGKAGGYWRRRSMPWDREWDYIDTRIGGDSFYKIFRFELIDPATGISTYAGVRGDGTPMEKRTEWLAMKTHLGNASFPRRYAADSRGGAVNLNQVNNNYPFEIYYAQEAPGPNQPYIPFHYNDAKWIYTYDQDERRRGRYAVLVWGDCGTPNANYMPDSNAKSRYVLMDSDEYFRILDTAFSPRGGPIGGGLSGKGADIIKSDTGVNWHGKLSDAIARHVKERGPLTSRAELNAFIRKTGGGGAMDPNQDADADGRKDIERDAEVICSLVSIHAYEPLLGPHWETDRLIIDALGVNDAADRSSKAIPGRALAENTEGTISSYMAAGNAGKSTRKQFLNTLEALKFFWGPDDAREGQHTPYRAGSGTGSGDPDEHQVAKSKFMSWIAAASFQASVESLDAASELGWAFDASQADPDFIGSAGSPAGKRDPALPDVTGGTLNANTSHSWVHPPAINEVGRLSPAQVSRLWNDLKAQKCRGAVRGDTSDLPDESKVIDVAKPYHFVEFVDQWDYNYYHSNFSFRGHKRGMEGSRTWFSNASSSYKMLLELYVGGADVFADPETRIVCIDADLDDRNGPDGYYGEDFKPRDAGNVHHVGQDRRRGRDSSGFAGQWAGDPPMVAPNYEELDRARPLTVRDRLQGSHVTADGVYHDKNAGSAAFRAGGDIIVASLNKFRYDPGAGRYRENTWKESHGRFLPVNYLLVLFSTKYDADEVVLAVNSGRARQRIVDYVRLPGKLSGGYSCFDFLTNQHPRMWARTGNVHLEAGGTATPAWRRRHAGRPDRANRDAWAHGLNANFISTWLPGGESWPAPLTPSGSLPFKLMGIDGWSKGGLEATAHHKYRPIPENEVSWPATELAELAYVTGDRYTQMEGWDRLMACPLGFFPRRPWAGAPVRPDLTLRIWRDLMRVAPLEQYFTIGYQGIKTTVRSGGGLRAHRDYPIYDAFDNNMDGHTDELVTRASYPGSAFYTDGHSRGHYLGDRAAIGRININELAHPAALFYCAQSTRRGRDQFDYKHQNTIVGRKPFKGYTSWADVLTRADLYGGSNDTPYNLHVWYENLYADCSADHFHGHRGSETLPSQVMGTSRILHAGNSPVYTIYVTAQTLGKDEKPLAEIKVRCTLERTATGKTNLLDFKWIPSDVQRGS